MPLKDLTVNTAELTEKWIEDIVAPYVNYDVEEKRIILRPSAASLPAKKKVLIYLVALRGWPFIEEGVPTSAKPGQIGEALGIQGGSLRPVLKDLKDSNFVSVSGQSYSVSLAALSSVKEQVETHNGRTRDRKTGTSAKRKKSTRNEGKASSKASSTSSRNREFFDREVAAGFFDEPKVLADVVERFHENGLTVHRGIISPLLLKAVRAGDLRRKKAEIKGRRVWAYERAK
jgi:hypothetical protein